MLKKLREAWESGSRVLGNNREEGMASRKLSEEETLVLSLEVACAQAEWRGTSANSRGGALWWARHGLWITSSRLFFGAV